MMDAHGHSKGGVESLCAVIDARRPISVDETKRFGEFAKVGFFATQGILATSLGM